MVFPPSYTRSTSTLTLSSTKGRRSHHGRPVCKKRSTYWLLGLSLPLLSQVSVHCFVIGEDANKLRPHRKLATQLPIPRTLDHVKDYRGGDASPMPNTGFPTFAKNNNNDNENIEVDLRNHSEGTSASNPSDPNSKSNFGDDLSDPSADFEGAEPLDVIVPTEEPKKSQLRAWPCFDKLDKELIRISLPVIGNYAINPLIGAVDLFWVNRMGNALAVAGQAAANQVFSSAFWCTSFLPSGM